MNRPQNNNSGIIYPQADYEEYIERLLEQQQTIDEVKQELQRKIIYSVTN
jgi:hypothetical protein